MANEEIRIANIETVLQAAIDLFIEHGIHNTTREMLARASGLSRRSTERYFSSMPECVVQAAEWFGRGLYERFQATKMLEDKEHTAAEILKVYLEELKQIAFDEPRIYACYAEFKSYLYRHSEQREVDYRKFMEAVGCRRILQEIFEMGERDGTVICHHNPRSDARYLTNTIMAYFSNSVLLYDTTPERMKQYISEYVSDTWRLYCDGKK